MAVAGAFVLFLARGYVWPTLSPVEVPTIRAMLDPSLFPRDFVVQESLHFTPRFYYNHLIAGLAGAGLPLAASFAILHLVALAILAVSIKALSESFGLKGAIAALFATAIVFCSNGCVGATFFLTHAPVPAVWAHCIALGGLALMVRGYPVAAYVCFGIAVLLQFLVGFYAGILALSLMRRRPNLAIPAIFVWGVALSLVYVPMALSDAAAAKIDDTMFVQIYAYVRHPHHLVPSQWPASEWVGALAFYAGTWMLLSDFGTEPRAMRFFRFALTVAIVGLLVNFAGVEIFSSTLVAKLQPARITPLLQCAALLAIFSTSKSPGELNDLDVLIRWSVLIFVPYGGAAVIAHRLISKWGTVRVGQIVLYSAAALGFSWVLALHPLRALALLGLAFLWWWFDKLNASPRAFIGATLALLLVALGACVWSVTDAYPAWLSARLSVAAAANTPTAKIGSYFKARTDSETLVLVPPKEECWDFKLYSDASVVVEEKHFPFTTAGILEWHERMKSIAALNEPRETAAPSSPVHQEPDLFDLAGRYGATHVLSRGPVRNQSSGATAVISLDGWTLWQMPRSH